MTNYISYTFPHSLNVAPGVFPASDREGIIYVVKISPNVIILTNKETARGESNANKRKLDNDAFYLNDEVPNTLSLWYSYDRTKKIHLYAKTREALREHKRSDHNGDFSGEQRFFVQIPKQFMVIESFK
jgi:hypothetical protein